MSLAKPFLKLSPVLVASIAVVVFSVFADVHADDKTQHDAEILAARTCFEKNLDAIRNRDQDAYLSTYWQSESLARNGWGGVQLGYADHAANSSDNNWPDVFDAQQLQLVWLRPGVVYGSYRYRVAYGDNESSGISERVFLNTDAGWRIAVTSAFGAPDGTPPPPVALIGATLWNGSGTGVIAEANVIVRSGRIDCAGSADSCVVPEGMAVIEMSRRWITPGLIDTNVHFSQSAWIDTRPDIVDVTSVFPYEIAMATAREQVDVRMLAWLTVGVTAVLDRGGFPWTLDLRASNASSRPHVAAVGPVVARRAVLPSLAGARQTLVVQTVDEVRSALRYLESRQVDVIVFDWDATATDASGLEQQTALLTAVAAQARQYATPLIVESPTLAGAKVAVRVGARMVHGVSDTSLDQEFLQEAKAADVLYGVSLASVANRKRFAQAALKQRVPSMDDPFAVVDTLTAELLAQTAELQLSATAVTALQKDRTQQRAQLVVQRNNVKLAHEAGLKIVFGTNAGSPLTLHGAALFSELEALQAAGLSATEVLQAATTNAALLVQRFEDRGVLRAGASADLVVLDADPTADITNMRRLAAVMRAGELRWKK